MDIKKFLEREKDNIEKATEMIVELRFLKAQMMMGVPTSWGDEYEAHLTAEIQRRVNERLKIPSFMNRSNIGSHEEESE